MKTENINANSSLSWIEIVSKYNLLAIPVVDRHNVLQGMVVIDDVIDDLMGKRRTNK